MWRSLPLLCLCGACIPPDPDATAQDVIAAAWTFVDERYALFQDKQVDWGAARAEADASAEGTPTDAQLFDTVAQMLNRLEDGHVNLVSSFSTSWVPAYLEEGLPTYDEDLVQRDVLAFNYQDVGSVRYTVTAEGWAYLRVDDFSTVPSAAALEGVFASFAAAPLLVVDLRGNGGGSLPQVARLAGHFIDAPAIGWHIQTSTGPAHGDLSEHEAVEISPAPVRYTGPVHLLVDNRSYSGANTFTYAISGADNVTVFGQPTGGGAGSPAWFELPNGWRMRFPVRRLTGPNKASIEAGFVPDVLVPPDPVLEAEGRDAMLEAASAVP